MVQVLPYVQSFGEQLVPALAEAGSTLAQGLQKRLENQQAQESYKILQDPKASSMQKVNAFSRLPEDKRKHLGPVLGAVLQPQSQAEQDAQQLTNLGFQFPKANQNEPAQQVPSGEPIPDKKDISQLSDQELVTMSAIKGPLERLASAEMKRREGKIKQDEALWNYKPTQTFVTEIENEAKSAETAITVADEFIRLAQSGKISPSNPQNFLASQFGENFPLLYTPETAQAKLLEKLQASGLKDIFPRPTQAEFFFINSAQAQLGKSDAANIAVANLQKKFSSIPVKAAEFTQEVIQENGGAPPRDLSAKVRQKMASYRKELFQDAASVNFEFGDASQRKKAAEFLDTRGKHLPLTDEKKKEIFKLAGNDPNKALKLAIELGYDIPKE